MNHPLAPSYWTIPIHRYSYVRTYSDRLEQDIMGLLWALHADGTIEKSPSHWSDDVTALLNYVVATMTLGEDCVSDGSVP